MRAYHLIEHPSISAIVEYLIDGVVTGDDDVYTGMPYVANVDTGDMDLLERIRIKPEHLHHIGRLGGLAVIGVTDKEEPAIVTITPAEQSDSLGTILIT